IGVRMSIDKRADGRPYIRITSPRPLNEPFIDLVIELSWAQGRLVREYSALIDPPGYGQPPATSVAVAPPAAPSPQPVTAPSTPAAKAPPGPAATEYTVKRGETLGKIAAALKPADVTLEQ